MQIVIPAAGNGSRFKQKGYNEPKPLIKTCGKSIIQWSTDGLRGIKNPKFIFLVLEKHIKENNIDKELKNIYKDCRIVPVSCVTEGAACTVLLAKDLLDLEEDLMIVNCDNLFLIDMDKVYSEIDSFDRGVIFYFAANSPALSYIVTDENNYVQRVAEKEIISDKATVGCYYFTKAKYFIEAAEQMIKNNIRVNNEFYVAPTYNIIISQGGKIRAFPVELTFDLGTPEKLSKFESIFSG